MSRSDSFALTVPGGERARGERPARVGGQDGHNFVLEREQVAELAWVGDLENELPAVGHPEAEILVALAGQLAEAAFDGEDLEGDAGGLVRGETRSGVDGRHGGIVTPGCGAVNFAPAGLLAAGPIRI